jgi:hypothetical protein
MRITESIKLSLSQASKDTQKRLVPIAYPALSVHLTKIKFLGVEPKLHDLYRKMRYRIRESAPYKLSEQRKEIL